MAINLDDLEKKEKSTNKNNIKMYVIFSAILLLFSGFAYQMGNKKANSEEKVEQKETLPAGVKKLSKLPINPPEFFKGEIKEVYEIGGNYVVGTINDNGQMAYDTLTKDGKFVMMTYIADSKTGKMVMDMGGFITDDNVDEQAQISQNTSQQNQAVQTDDGELLTKTYLKNGMKESFFTSDLTSGEHSFKTKAPVQTKAVGVLKKNPDLFVRHVIDALYNTTLHSDTLKGEYKNSPQQPIYIMYDPNCPHCQVEMPKIESLKAKGYDFIYVPIPALSPAPTINDDSDFHYQLFAPALGWQNLLETLSSKAEYVRPAGKIMTQQQKEYAQANLDTFKSIPQAIKEYYENLYNGNMQSYGYIAEYAVPTMIYVDRETGEVHFSNIEQGLLELAQ